MRRRIIICCPRDESVSAYHKMGSGYQSFLNNKYWILRHGRSIPNENGLVVSSLENGVLEEYQLASHGVRQARLAGESFLKDLKENNIGLENVRICYSPFARTTHTAKVVASVLDIPFDGPQCKAILDIRERFFGPSYELKSHDKYPEIWALDEKDPFMQPEGGESVADVVTRLTKALAVMESEYKGCSVLIVSHGDPLQILQTIVSAAKEDESTHENDFISRLEAVKVHSVLSQHRKFALDTGELRQLMAENTCLDRKADISNRRRDKWSYSNSRAISHFLFSGVPSHIISTRVRTKDSLPISFLPSGCDAISSKIERASSTISKVSSSSNDGVVTKLLVLIF